MMCIRTESGLLVGSRKLNSNFLLLDTWQESPCKSFENSQANMPLFQGNMLYFQ